MEHLSSQRKTMWTEFFGPQDNLRIANRFHTNVVHSIVSSKVLFRPLRIAISDSIATQHR